MIHAAKRLLLLLLLQLLAAAASPAHFNLMPPSRSIENNDFK
jgi:hypothetical protein